MQSKRSEDCSKCAVGRSPPRDYCSDKEFFRKFRESKGYTIVSGGTTANIIARELKENVEIDNEFIKEVVKGVLNNKETIDTKANEYSSYTDACTPPVKIPFHTS